jgi:hypothetical protein
MFFFLQMFLHGSRYRVTTDDDSALEPVTNQFLKVLIGSSDSYDAATLCVFAHSSVSCVFVTD